MAWSELTVTGPNPTPPTNMSFTGTTAPNPPNYTKVTYADRTNWGGNTAVSPPPYYDDGSAGSLVAVAAKTAALASGSAATAGGTEGTYPGAAAGAVPASTSVDPEATALVTVQTYTVPNSHPPSPSTAGLLNIVTTMGNWTGTPNATHPSSTDVAPAVAPTVSGATAESNVSSAAYATTVLTVTGTGFRQNSVVLMTDIAQPTTFVSTTSLKVMNAVKKTSAGTVPIKVKTGATTTASVNWTLT